MNNKELLIHLLLELRSGGIKNQNILKVVEGMPPHYYLSFFHIKKYKINFTINELVQVVKILELAFTKKRKYENVLVIGIKKGWLLPLVSKLCKRVYSICDSNSQKKILENLFLKNNLRNIYLKVEKDFSSWKKVSPFDVIIYLKENKSIPSIFQSYLSNNGIVLMPNIIKKNHIKFIEINKKLEIANTSLEYKFLENSHLI